MNVEQGPDRNKTPLTHAITRGMEIYLKERGYKPIESEVCVEIGWSADLAACVVPSNTELQDMKLMPRKPTGGWAEKFRRKYGNPKEGEIPYFKQPDYLVAAEAFQKKLNDWDNQAKSFLTPITALVEVKVTRGDFLRDDKFIRPSPTNLRYLAVPAGLLKRNEFPIGWFVLEFNAEGKCLRTAQTGDYSKVTTEQRLWTVHEIAVRRHHRTEHTWLRDVMKRQNARELESRQNLRVSRIARAILGVFGYGDSYRDKNSAKEYFQSACIKWDSLDYFTQQTLEEVWAKRTQSPGQNSPQVKTLSTDTKQTQTFAENEHEGQN